MAQGLPTVMQIQRRMDKKTTYYGILVFKSLMAYKIRIGAMAAFLCLALMAQSQESWKISKCIDYAMENNLDLNMKYNEIQTQEVTLKESKANIFPDLNLGSSLDLNFGRNIDGNDNSVTYDPTLTNSYWVTSSFTLFQGLAKKNNVRFNKFLLKATEQGVEVEKNKLVFNILTLYYTVLYSQGLRDVAESQVELSKMQFERMQKLVEVGKESPITAQDLESQWAADKLSLTRAQNQLNKSVLELKQMLRLGAQESFTIDSTATDQMLLQAENNVDALFEKAKEILPQLKQQTFLMDASERTLAAAKGGIYPSLSLQAGYSTGFYDGDNTEYGKQLENNQNQWVTMSLRFPIFNHAYANSNIKRKRIALNDQKLQYEKQKEALYTEIWNALEDLKSAEKEFESSQELENFSELSLKNVTKRLEKGLANTTEFETAKQRYISAKATLLKSKLMYVMRHQMLTYYQTANWNHLY